MKKELYDAIMENPVIVGIKNDEELLKCLTLKERRVVFVIYGNICTIPEIVEKLKNAGMIVMVHADLIAGLGAKEVAVDFIKKNTRADGVISTKPSIIKRAIELNLYTALRIFLLDSMAFENIDRQLSYVDPDVVEILPGSMPKMIAKVKKKIRQPIIASGLIMDREDIITALDAGAMAVSSTNQKVWEM